MSRVKVKNGCFLSGLKVGFEVRAISYKKENIMSGTTVVSIAKATNYHWTLLSVMEVLPMRSESAFAGFVYGL